MRLAVPIIASLALAGCIDVLGPPGGAEPMCEVTSDCNVAAGQVCDQGICWGDPPEDIRFAAILVPPADRPDLVRTELPDLSIADDGAVAGLDFVAPKTLSGQVRITCLDSSQCDPTASVSARITAKRRSRIPGGPTYSRTVVAQAGVREGPAFTLRLPLTGTDDPPYEITITPDDVELEGGASAASLAPPIRFSLSVTNDVSDLDWVLGNPEELKVIKGRVVDAANRGLAGMEVWALGRWTALGQPERASSIATTDAEGQFVLRIPTAMLDVYDLIVKPAPGTVAPSLRKLGVIIPDPQVGEDYIALEDLRMPSYAEAVPYVIPVRGFDGSGELKPVAGAEVRLTTVLLDDAGVLATYGATAFTDAEGHARFDLIPGGGQQNRVYVARVLPPAGAKHASLFGAEISVGLANQDGDSWLPTLQLGDRVAVTGTVVDAGGHVVPGATVSASASVGFLLQLSADSRATLDDLQLPSATSDERGVFMFWIDPALVGLEAVYDLEIAPPTGSQAPRWSVRAIGAAQSTSGAPIDLGDVWLPPASYARGPVRAPDGPAVPAAEVRLYEVSPEAATSCAGVTGPFGETECEYPVILRGLWQSRADGQVWMALPDPGAD